MVEKAALDMEAGGLMIPLTERKLASTLGRLETAQKASALSNTPATGVPQLDGANDDDHKIKLDDPDDEAINSDLDDPEDDAIDEVEDETLSEFILCTYDKVQRVKNKWKCTLKDGVLQTNGKE